MIQVVIVLIGIALAVVLYKTQLSKEESTAVTLPAEVDQATEEKLLEATPVPAVQEELKEVLPEPKEKKRGRPKKQLEEK